MNTRYIVQSWTREQYVTLFQEALQQGTYTNLYVAVAYATNGGVYVLDRVFRKELGEQWCALEKQWLVGIDWCRTDPSALSRLTGLPNSLVKVPDGAFLVGRTGCRAVTPYHPKLFVLCGPDTSAIICGSGNLSISGLTKGCECGTLTLIRHDGTDGAGANQLAQVIHWFTNAWANASNFDATLGDQYRCRCKDLVKEGRQVPADDDVVPPEEHNRRRGLSEAQVRALRTYDNFWIEAGTLGSNLGRGRPGNQLDMTRYTRVFFGVSASEVPPNTDLAHVTLMWDGTRHTARTLKFGDNGMDKLNVPPTGDRGPFFYAKKTLLFTRQPDGDFAFSVGDERQSEVWLRASRQGGILTRMPGGNARQWGLF